MARETDAARSERRLDLPTGVGAPSITDAPEVRIAQTPTGHISVWVAGVGYLDPKERRALGRLLSGVPNG
jgi:hypothetical protein